MLKELQDLLKAAEKENHHLGLALRIQITPEDIRVSGFGKKDSTYNTAMKVEQFTLDTAKVMIDKVVARLAMA